MTGQHRLSGVDSEQILDALRGVVNEASVSLRKIREWCDKTEAAASGGQSEPVFQARMELIDQVRALLPPVPETAEGVEQVDGTRVTPGSDREY